MEEGNKWNGIVSYQTESKNYIKII